MPLWIICTPSLSIPLGCVSIDLCSRCFVSDQVTSAVAVQLFAAAPAHRFAIYFPSVYGGVPSTMRLFSSHAVCGGRRYGRASRGTERFYFFARFVAVDHALEVWQGFVFARYGESAVALTVRGGKRCTRGSHRRRRRTRSGRPPEASCARFRVVGPPSPSSPSSLNAVAMHHNLRTSTKFSAAWHGAGT